MIASLYDKPLTFPYFDEILKTRPQDLIREDGAFMMARYIPNILDQIINLAHHNAAVLSVLITASKTISGSGYPLFYYLCSFAPNLVPDYFKLALRSPPLFESVITHLKQDINSRNGFELIVRDTPKIVMAMLQVLPDAIINDLLKFAVNRSTTLNAWCDALTLKNDRNETMFHWIIKEKPYIIEEILNLAIQTNNILLRDKIDFCLNSIDDKQINGLQLLCFYRPSAVSNLFTLMPSYYALQKTVIKWLLNKNVHGETGFDILFQHAPDAAISLFKVAEESYSLLVVIKNNMSTYFNALLKYSSNATIAFFELIKNKNDQTLTNNVITLLKNKNVDNITGFQLLVNYAPGALEQLFLIIKENNLSNEIAALLQDRDNNHETIFNQLIKRSPTFLLQLITMANNTDDQVLVNTFKMVLGKKNKKGLTELQVLAKNEPLIAKKMIQLAGKHRHFLLTIVNLLSEQTNESDDSIIFHVLCKNRVMHELIKLMNHQENDFMIEKIGKLLNKTTKENYTVFYMLAAYDPIAVKNLVKIIVKTDNQELLQILVSALKTKTNEGRSGFYALMLYAPDVIADIANVATKIKKNSSIDMPIIKQFLDVIVTEATIYLNYFITHSLKSFFSFCKLAAATNHVPLIKLIEPLLEANLTIINQCPLDIVPDILNLAIKQNCSSLILKIEERLRDKTTDNTTCMQMIISANPQSLAPLMSVLSQNNNINKNITTIFCSLIMKDQNNQVGWQKIPKDQIDVIFKIIAECLLSLSTDDLLQMHKTLQTELDRQAAHYASKHSLFSYEEKVLQQLMVQLNNVLTGRSVKQIQTPKLNSN